MSKIKSFPLEYSLLIAWFVGNLCLGLLVVRDFGVSYDEPGYYEYAESSLAAYRSVLQGRAVTDYGLYPEYGPAFIVAVAFTVEQIRSAFPAVFVHDLWHYSYFLLFQLTGVCLYALTRRWFSAWTAWCILILFTAQPLLWGHAFINPKDVPFMFFFTLSAWTSLRLADGHVGPPRTISLAALRAAATTGWNRAEARGRQRFVRLLALLIVSALLVVALQRTIGSVLHAVVAFFYEAEPSSWAGRFFGSAAPLAGRLALENYVSKAETLFVRLELGILSISLLGLGAYFGLLIAHASPSAWMDRILKRAADYLRGIPAQLGSLRGSIGRQSPIAFLGEVWKQLSSLPVVTAGVALGLATSVRILGPLAGLIGLAYLFGVSRQNRLAAAAAYGVWAAAATYLAWPFLWPAPVQRLLQSASMMANFPWAGLVLFDGARYSADNLPWSYLPVLMNLQLTEPFLLICYSAIGVSLWQLLFARVRADWLIYVGLGFGLPLAAMILFRPPLYDNFRQLLFLLPAAFVLAASGVEAFFGRIRSTWLRLALVIAVSLPGIGAIVRLHPYQYIYYNSLAGGVGGAADRFELDYWRTSFREIALRLNQDAAQGAAIVTVGASHTFVPYARPDLRVDAGGEYDYAIIPSKWGRAYPDAEVLLTIERDGAVLATVKRIRSTGSE